LPQGFQHAAISHRESFPSPPPEHLRILRESGILLRSRGNLYSLNPIYLVSGKPGHVDLGSCLFRLDVPE